MNFGQRTLERSQRKSNLLLPMFFFWHSNCDQKTNFCTVMWPK